MHRVSKAARDDPISGAFGHRGRASTTGRRIRTVNALLAFYRGEGPDDRGRMLTDILQQDDAWLERTHDYVQ